MTMFLRRRGLEQHGVDHRIADKCAQCQPHGERVHPFVQDQHAQRADDEREHQRLGDRQSAARQRAGAGAHHLRVDVLLDQAIDGECGACKQAYPQAAEHDRAGRRKRGCRYAEEHPDDRGEHGEQRHPRLGERQELLKFPRGEYERGHCWRWIGRRMGGSRIIAQARSLSPRGRTGTAVQPAAAGIGAAIGITVGACTLPATSGFRIDYFMVGEVFEVHRVKGVATDMPWATTILTTDSNFNQVNQEWDDAAITERSQSCTC